MGVAGDKSPAGIKAAAAAAVSKSARPESSVKRAGPPKWGKLQREGSIRSASPKETLVEKMAAAARVVNKLLKGSALKKVGSDKRTNGQMNRHDEFITTNRQRQIYVNKNINIKVKSEKGIDVGI